MRFALLGDHADGLDMARALTQSGRHEIAVYSGSTAGLQVLQRWGLQPRAIGDMEEVLADPAIEAVIVAGGPSGRAVQLRRALQSERHVLCVHPAGDSPNVAYEADMIRAEVNRVLFPLLPEALHPGIRRLAELAGEGDKVAREDDKVTRWQDDKVTKEIGSVLPRSPGHPDILSSCHLFIERRSTDSVLLQPERAGERASFVGWDTLRRIGGEIRELFLLAGSDDLAEEGPLLLSGQFVRGGLFQETFLPGQAENRLRLNLITSQGRAELFFPDGWPGPSQLTICDSTGNVREESWPADNPWVRLVECFEAACGVAPGSVPASAKPQAVIGWRDALRALELDDAARRSLHRRRSSTLEFVEATDETSFKGSMTLLGCGLLWLILALTIASMWIPQAGWLILPALGGFLAMQLLRRVVEEPRTK